MRDQQSVIIVGSGLSIHQLSQLDTSDWTVVALNKAWQFAPERMDMLIHSDMLAGSQRPPPGLFSEKCVLSYPDYHPVVRRFAEIYQDRFGQAIEDPAMFLTGHLIHFNASYWVMDQIKPRRIAYLGCDFDYSQQQSHFYGKGQAIFAVEQGRPPLAQYFRHQQWFAQTLGIELFNLSTSKVTQLPYPKLDFSPWQTHEGSQPNRVRSL